MTVAEASKVADLFLLVGEDEELLGRYERDPRSVLEASGLDQGAIATLLEGELEEVRTLVDDELASDPLRRRFVTTPRMGLETPPPPEPDEPEPDDGDDGDGDEGQQ